MAALLAHVLSSSQRNRSACVIVALLQQLAKFGDIGLAQSAAFAEMLLQRRHAAVEQALQQAFDLLRHPGLPRQHPRIQTAAALGVRPYRPLFLPAVEQGFALRLGPGWDGADRR